MSICSCYLLIISSAFLVFDLKVKKKEISVTFQSSVMQGVFVKSLDMVK